MTFPSGRQREDEAEVRKPFKLGDGGYAVNGHNQRPFVWSGRGIAQELGTRAYGALQREDATRGEPAQLLELWEMHANDRLKAEERRIRQLEALEAEIMA